MFNRTGRGFGLADRNEDCAEAWNKDDFRPEGRPAERETPASGTGRGWESFPGSEHGRKEKVSVS